MKVTYFDDAHTLYIELRAGEIAETRGLDENTLLDLDAARDICAMTFRARQRAHGCRTHHP
jgi:uncharacterized protein YuzE